MNELIQELELLTAEQMQTADKAAIDAGTPSYDLMTMAGNSAAFVIRERFSPMPVLVLAGGGNNGGDGYIIAQSLLDDGWEVICSPIGAESPKKPDLIHARGDFKGEVREFSTDLLESNPLIVDAIFGTGLSKPPGDEVKKIIAAVRERNLPVVAVDIPSGVNADSGEVMGDAFDAAITVTFMRKKLGHVLIPGKNHCGEVLVANIGIPEAVMESVAPRVWENDPVLWLPLFPAVASDAHKYSRGHSVVLGGGITQTGAAKLASRAALRSGAGLVSVACDEKSLPVYAASLSAIMTKQTDTVDAFSKLLEDERVTSVIIGPGAGITEYTRQSVLTALRLGKKCVIDADAISAFEDTPETLFNHLKAECLLTPHEGEFERLFKGVVDLNKVELTKIAAKKANATILLKGADTVIASPDGRAVVNSNAPSDLATAGSGDVLAGICGGLIAQGMPTFEAACAAAWMHGFTAASIGAGLIAEDLTETLPSAITMLRNLKG